MEIRWLGTASAEIVCGEKHILVDPYFQKSSRMRKWQNPAMRDAVLRADAILITHPHLDHFADIRRIVGMTDAPIYVSERGIRTAKTRRANTATLHAIHAGDTFVAADTAEVRVWPACHVQFDEALVKRVKKRAYRIKNYPRGLHIWWLNRQFPITDDDIFAFEIAAGGRTLFILGSANLCEDTDYPTGANALLFPYQGRSDLDSYSMPLIERLRPENIILTHFDDAFPPVSERVDTTAFRTRFQNAREAEFNEVVII